MGKFGSVSGEGFTPGLRETWGGKWLTDVAVGYNFSDNLRLTIGANNVFDVYPDRTPANLLSSTGVVSYPFYSPFGFNGRYLYAKVGVDW